MAGKNESRDVVLAYPARFTKEGKEIVVTFRDIDRALTSGNSESEAIAAAQDCLAEAVAGLLAEGEAIPAPSPAMREERLIPLDPIVAAKAMLSDAMRSSSVTQSELARRLGADTRSVQRLLDPHHASRMDNLMDALSQVGIVAAMTVINAGENRRILRSTKGRSNGGVLFRPMKALRGRPAKAVGES